MGGCINITSMTEQLKPQGKPAAEIMRRLFEENPNDPDIKRQLKQRIDNAERYTFYAFTGSEEQYLQARGLTHHDEEEFNYINMVLHQRTVSFLEKIATSTIEVRSTLPQPAPPPPEAPREIIEEVEQVLENVDLPLSLFKRQDQYWSQDNPKTQQVKEYLKELHEQDRQWRNELKRRRQQVLNEQNERYHLSLEEQAKAEQKAKQQERQRIAKRIEQLKNMGEARKRTIQESLDVIKKHGRPLFKKMEEEFYNRVELPSLEEKKRKLTEVRQLRRSVDLNEIQQHREKYEKIKEEHEGVRITNQPLKVAFKSHFHQTMQKARTADLDHSRAHSLLDRRQTYAQSVRENYKPAVDEQKAAEIAERIENMNKRFTRAKNHFQRPTKGEEDDEEEEEEEEEEPEPEPEPEEDEDDEDDEDDENKIEMPKDDQYEPTYHERYRMGLKYLQIARAKRNQQAQTQRQQKQGKEVKGEGQKGDTLACSEVQVGRMSSNEASRKIKYRNYLQEISKTNRTIDFIDTSRIKGQLTNDLRVKETANLEELSNKIRTVQERAKNEEQLLKHRKVKKQQAIGKKVQLDNAIIDTIKARLAIMKN